MKTKTNKVLSILELIFSIMACIFLVVTIILVVSGKQFIKNGKLTTATITDLNSSDGANDVTIAYEVDGKQYECTKNEHRSSWDIGDEIEIYYSVSNPANVRIKSMMFFLPIMFGIFGGIYLIVVIVLEIIRRCSSKKKARLMETGRKVYATITEVSQNYKVRVNGRYPYQAKATYTDDYSGQSYQMKSKNFWEDSSNLLGQEVPVYINPKNPKDYYMDIDYLFGRKAML